MNNSIRHFIIISKHRNYVLKNCIKAGIPFQGLVHDLSKYSPTEFNEGKKFFQGNRSPNEAAREKNGYSLAWMHHKGRNKHHFEYWTDINFKTKEYEPVKMPYKYVCEMFCDRVAASKIYLKQDYTDSAPLEYFLRGTDKRRIHKETSGEIEKLLRMLAETGEKNTFLYIRNSLKNKT